jgi:hypothetical protein
VLAAVALLAGAAGPAVGQAVAVGARGGTFGLGGEAVLGLGRIALRAGAGVVPFTPTGTHSGITYEIEPPSPLLNVGVDLYLTGGLRLIGGLLFGAETTSFTAQLAESVRIGDHTYQPGQVGELAGELQTRSAAPFIGLGFGSYGHARVGLTLDLGVAFLGENDLELAANGPIAGDATFQQELEKERLGLESDLRRYTRFLPVLNLGFHVSLGR